MNSRRLPNKSAPRLDNDWVYFSPLTLQVSTQTKTMRPESGECVLENPQMAGYTIGMKTAISIPDDVFEQAERFARQVRKSRSQLYSEAIKEYVARHSPDEVTETMNRVCDELGEHERKPDAFVTLAARRILEQTEW